MRHELICSWLGLTGSDWPPDHYQLLDLPRGETDRQQIEARVHDRLNRVRRYQLTHPELATEAMNRLAQAFVCLTDPFARARYDRELLGLSSPVPPPLPPLPNLETIQAEHSSSEQTIELVLTETLSRVLPASAPSETKTVEQLETLAEVPILTINPINPANPAQLLPPPIRASLLPPTSARPATRQLPPPLPGTMGGSIAPVPPLDLLDLDLAVAVPVEEVVLSSELPAVESVSPEPLSDSITDAARSPRVCKGLWSSKQLYDRALQTRRMQSYWHSIGQYLSDPARKLLRGEAKELIRLLEEIDVELAYFAPPLGEAGQPGYMILALTQMDNPRNTVVTLSTDQRESLARDWQAGHKFLRCHCRCLLDKLQHWHRLPWFTRQLLLFRGLVNDYPTHTGMLALVVLVIAAILWFLFWPARWACGPSFPDPAELAFVQHSSLRIAPDGNDFVNADDTRVC